VPNRRRIILVVTNDLTGDQRLHRVASTLADAGWDVLLVGRLRKASQPLAPRPYATHRMKLWAERGKLFYIEYAVRLWWFLLFRRASVLTANDIDTLLPITAVSLVRRIPVVLDCHEFFTEVPELVHRPLTRRLWRCVERLCVPFVRRISTVNAPLAQQLEARYGKPVAVVRNVPFRRPAPPPRTAPGAQNPPVRIVYQGAVNVGRGLDMLLEAAAQRPHWQVWVIGGGDVLPEVQAQARVLGLGDDRVRFFGHLPFDQLPPLTRQADVGVSLEADLGANYRYCLPNKLFDYLQAGLPVVVTPLPVMADLVQQYGCGVVLPDRTVPHLLAALDALLADAPRYHALHTAALAAAQDLCWERERHALLDLYQGL